MKANSPRYAQALRWPVLILFAAGAHAAFAFLVFIPHDVIDGTD